MLYCFLSAMVVSPYANWDEMSFVFRLSFSADCAGNGLVLLDRPPVHEVLLMSIKQVVICFSKKPGAFSGTQSTELI